MIGKPTFKLSALVSVLVLSGCAQPGLQTGGSSNLVTGSAGGGTSVNANKSLERCATPLGTLAVADGRLTGSNSVTTVNPLIRLAIQQSNCFVISSIGNLATESQLDRILDKQRNSGEVRAKQHKGQQVAADYFLEPEVIVNNETTSGQSGSAAGSLVGLGLGAAGLGGIAGLASGVAGTLAAGGVTETKTTDVALTLTDIRSRVQIAIAQGSSTATNMSVGGSGAFGGWSGLFGGAGGASIGTFKRTPEGIATAAAFFDAYNSMVQSLRNYHAQEVKGGLGRGGAIGVGD
ncbi:MAG: hypothetical protein ABL925_07140 [Methylococcales bacterium]